MKRLVAAALLVVLSGCPGKNSPQPTQPNQEGGFKNGPRVTGVEGHDAPAPVTAVHLQRSTR